MPLYVVECIKIEQNERHRQTPKRKMFGPYADEDEALEAVEDFGREYDNVIAHVLYPPDEAMTEEP